MPPRRSRQGGSLIFKMDHLACFVGGMFVLGSKYSNDPEAHMKVRRARGGGGTAGDGGRRREAGERWGGQEGRERWGRRGGRETLVEARASDDRSNPPRIKCGYVCRLSHRKWIGV